MKVEKNSLTQKESHSLSLKTDLIEIKIERPEFAAFLKKKKSLVI